MQKLSCAPVVKISSIEAKCTWNFAQQLVYCKIQKKANALWFLFQSKMENQIYKVVNIEGKGMGCVALKDIKPGTIILNEVPQYTIQRDVLIGKVIHQKLKFISIYF